MSDNVSTVINTMLHLRLSDVPFLISNIFYTFRLLVHAIKKKVVSGGGGAEDL